MPVEAWISVGVVAAVALLLISDWIAADVAMLGGLVVLVLTGALDADAAIAGFAHPAIVMISSLFVVAAGLSQTGATELVSQKLLGRPKTVSGAQLRMMAPVALLSGVMNNTPIVAIYLPIVGDWARKIGVSPSKLYLPLSFAAILGGQLTAIGTASNLVVLGLYGRYAEQHAAAPALVSAVEFWGPAALGFPAVLVGIAFILLTAHWLLPERRPAAEAGLDARQYTVQMAVQDDSPVVGKSIEDAGLRHLPGLYLAEVERGADILPAPGPEERLQAGDILSFAGVLDSVVDLRRIRGLVPATDQVDKVRSQRSERELVEAVISRRSPLVGRTVRASRFRTTYNAAIIAVHRNGERLKGKVGDIRLRAGDTLLLETHRGFVSAYRNSDDFFLVSAVPGTQPLRHDKGRIALAILGMVVVALAFGLLPPFLAGLCGAVAMVFAGCITAAAARAAINLRVILVIAAAIGIGAALQETGVAARAAELILGVSQTTGMGPRSMLFVTTLFASVAAQLITNYGAAAMLFPVAMASADQLGVSPVPFMFALLLGSGANLLTPIGYQTNLMVFGPGGYRFLDFTRMGLPLVLLLSLLAAWLAPVFFPF